MTVRRQGFHSLTLRGFIAALSAVASLVAAGAAHADARGEKVLKLMDAELIAADDQVIETEMVIQSPGKKPQRIGMVVHVRGDKQRRVHFTSPGDIKGMKMLVLSRTQMYIYMPAYRKVRRIASHVRAQTTFGADYNYDDMSTVTYSPTYKARFESETKTHWTVIAARRPGAESPYAKIRFRVRKDIKLPDKLEYFNDKGAKIKSEQRSEYTCQQSGKKKICGAARMKMVDHTRNEHWTEIVRKSWKVNAGFSQRVFSLRRLQRGR